MTDFDLKSLRGPNGLYPSDIVDLIVGQDPLRRSVDNAIRGIVVANTRFNRAYDFLKSTLLSSGGGQEGRCGFLYGPSGVGKSTVRRDNQDENRATIRMRMRRRGGVEGRA